MKITKRNVAMFLLALIVLLCLLLAIPVLDFGQATATPLPPPEATLTPLKPSLTATAVVEPSATSSPTVVSSPVPPTETLAPTRTSTAVPLPSPTPVQPLPPESGDSIVGDVLIGFVLGALGALMVFSAKGLNAIFTKNKNR